MNRRCAGLLGALAGALALLLTPSCIAEPGAPIPAAAATGEAGGERGELLWAATWSLTWDQSGVVSGRDGCFSVETDLGYRVTVDSGWFIDHSVTFGPCDSGSANEAEGSGGGAEAALRFLGLGVRQAHAHQDADP